MATANRKLKVCAFILMIFLSLGYAFYLSFSENISLPKTNKTQQTYELLSLEEARLSSENQIKNSIQSMLDSWFGKQKTKVSVRIQMDFSQSSQTKEALDIDNPALSKAIGDEVEYTYAKQTFVDSQKSGKIKQISIAVLVDNQMPLSEKKRMDLKRLIEGASGFDVNRGDSLEIIETSFAKEPFFSSSVWSHSLFVFMVIFLFVLFGVIMTKNGINAEQIEAPPAILPAFTNPMTYPDISSPVDGQVKENALKTAQNLLKNKPNETISLLRSWLCQTEEKHE